MVRYNRKVPTESDEQQCYFRALNYYIGTYPELRMAFHVPNEGKRTNGGRMKSEGLVRGVPDIFLDYPRGGYHGLRIELKRTKMYKIEPDQKEWIRKLNAAGYAAAFCYGWNDAWEFTEAYLTCNKAEIEKRITKSLEACERDR